MLYAFQEIGRRVATAGYRAHDLRGRRAAAHRPRNDTQRRARCQYRVRDVPRRSAIVALMPEGYLPIFIFLLVAILFPVVTIIAAKLVRPSAPSIIKLEAYECGIKAASDSRGRYTVRFYILAILFVIFDVETIFLFPWAVRYRQLGWFGVAEVAVFLIILIVGYIWAYKKGALEWV
jgi:NADH-quinone oxidoreductase subunit A